MPAQERLPIALHVGRIEVLREHNRDQSRTDTFVDCPYLLDNPAGPIVVREYSSDLRGRRPG